MPNWSPFTMFGVGLLIGTGVTIVSMPPIMKSRNCETYRVSNKVATSYALKPPFVNPEPAKCPVQVTKQCENVSSPEVTNELETKDQEPRRHRRYRHHRTRAYWK